jgi:hypothetical protein
MVTVPEPPRVFISYSHEEVAHNARVVGLANRLRTEDGVDAIIDRYVQSPPEGWARWVQRQIDEADFVLCVCSASYLAAFEGRGPEGAKRGADQEGFLITQSLYRAGHRSERFLPVLFEPWQEDLIPIELAGPTYFRLPQEHDWLVRLVTGQPEIVKPELGPPRRVPPSPALVQSNGFRLQAELTAPETMPLPRLAPGEGLFLSRIINPQKRGRADVISTVWLAAKGPAQYIVDSVRIKDVVAGPAGPMGVVAEPPDAEYRFTFAEYSDEVHALNPALSIGPETRDRASFTIGVSPAGPL